MSFQKIFLAIIGVVIVLCLIGCDESAERLAFKELQTISDGVEAERIAARLTADEPTLKHVGSTKNDINKMRKEAWAREAEIHLTSLRLAVSSPKVAESERESFLHAVKRSERSIESFSVTAVGVNSMVGRNYMNVAVEALEAAKSNGVLLTADDVVQFGPPVAKAQVKKNPSRAITAAKAKRRTRTIAARRTYRR